MSVYTTGIDSERLAQRVALNYVSEKLGASLATTPRSVQSAVYVTTLGRSPVVADLGKSAYREVPPSKIKVKPTPKSHHLVRTIFRPKRKLPIQPPVEGWVTPKVELPLAFYKKALASQIRSIASYEPISQSPVLVVDWSKPKTETQSELRELWRVVVGKVFELQQEQAAHATDDRWVDEGLKHPPLQDVHRVHVRLNLIGPLPPRIAYDPDRE